MQDLNNAQFKRDNMAIMTFIVKNSKWNKGIRISVLCKYVGEWLK